MRFRRYGRTMVQKEEDMTTGTLMFYGGIGGTASFSLLLIIILATAGKSRRKMIDKIQREL